MIATSDFRKGMTKVLFRNEPWLVIDFSHVKPGKGGAFVRTKLKNMKSGLVLEETFRSGEKFEAPDLRQSSVQYLYNEGDLYHFLDQESFEQYTFNSKQIESVLSYLKDETLYTILFFEEKPIVVEAPTFMNLRVVETVPGVKGDTAQGGSKPAKLETGISIQVPLFVTEDDVLKVDTRENIYIERVVEPSSSKR
jgi:elongation factor P